jgi:hypothetical protein
MLPARIAFRAPTGIGLALVLAAALLAGGCRPSTGKPPPGYYEGPMKGKGAVDPGGAGDAANLPRPSSH